MELSSHSSAATITECIFLSCNKNENIKFKWLMPKKFQELFFHNETIQLNEQSKILSFCKLDTFYKHRMLVVSIHDVCDCFEDQIQTYMNSTMLFINFLCDCPVHTLVKNFNFESVLSESNTDPNAVVDFLNGIWGNRYFSLEEAKLRRNLLNLPVIKL